MKQSYNIGLLLIVLSIPFALSQTRKAIPPGRYEALLGIKASGSQKNNETLKKQDSLGLFWSEVSKRILFRSGKSFYYSFGVVDPNFKTLLLEKGIKEAKSQDVRVGIILSDNLDRDNDKMNKPREKGSFLVLKDKHPLKDVLFKLRRYEVVLYQAEIDNNYYLLKYK